MTRATRHRQIARWATIAALAIVAGPFCTAVHYATVTHVVCAEHGGTVHEVGHAPQTAQHAAHSEDVGGEAPRPPSEGEHSHCDLLATVAPATLLAAPQPPAAPESGPPALVSTPPALAPRAAASVYAFAPKTSPPAVPVSRA
ncbi:MAG: hypothetical protein R3F39_10390 [Myxococcota bacterium]